MFQVEEGPVGAADDWGEGRVQHGPGVPGRAVGHVVLVEELHDVVVHPVLGHVPRQPIHVVCDVSVGKMVQQDLCGFKTAFPSSEEEWSLLLDKQRINILAASVWGD